MIDNLRLMMGQAVLLLWNFRCVALLYCWNSLEPVATSLKNVGRSCKPTRILGC